MASEHDDKQYVVIVINNNNSYILQPPTSRFPDFHVLPVQILVIQTGLGRRKRDMLRVQRQRHLQLIGHLGGTAIWGDKADD